MKFHHIGIATEDIPKMIKKMQKFFEINEISDIIYDPNQDANLCMLTLKDKTKIIVVADYEQDSKTKLKLNLFREML